MVAQQLKPLVLSPETAAAGYHQLLLSDGTGGDATLWHGAAREGVGASTVTVGALPCSGDPWLGRTGMLFLPPRRLDPGWVSPAQPTTLPAAEKA